MPAPSAAEQLNEDGHALKEAGDLAGAEAAYREAALLAPEWSAPLYNLGLLFKHQGRWQESFDFNERAAALDPDEEASNWNMAIAATALGRWADARRAWVACGITMPPGHGPPDSDLGITPIRLDPDGDGEVVWARRIDPARARIDSVPLPSTVFRWGDIVLNDGASEGERVVEGEVYPVFNVLMRLTPSAFETFIVELGTASDAAIDRLVEIAEADGGYAENWGTSTRILCRACSFGRPHEHTGADGQPSHPHCGIAARDRAQADRILKLWLTAFATADFVRMYPAHGEPT
jgi:tetratricopeptide (TPR) repeat protein